MYGCYVFCSYREGFFHFSIFDSGINDDKNDRYDDDGKEQQPLWSLLEFNKHTLLEFNLIQSL